MFRHLVHLVASSETVQSKSHPSRSCTTELQLHPKDLLSPGRLPTGLPKTAVRRCRMLRVIAVVCARVLSPSPYPFHEPDHDRYGFWTLGAEKKARVPSHPFFLPRALVDSDHDTCETPGGKS